MNHRGTQNTILNFKFEMSDLVLGVSVVKLLLASDVLLRPRAGELLVADGGGSGVGGAAGGGFVELGGGGLGVDFLSRHGLGGEDREAVAFQLGDGAASE